MSSATAQWLETVGEKRKLRDKAISNFLDGQSGSSEVPGYVAVRRTAYSQVLVTAATK
jgi:hypothetical protein